MNIIDKIDQEQMRFDLPDFRPGDTVKVHIRIIEGNKERVQIFQGVVLKRKRGKMGANRVQNVVVLFPFLPNYPNVSA